MFFRSERLFLRPFWPEDWQGLHAAISDEAVVRHLARAPWPYTEADARLFAARQQDSRFPHFLITLPDAAGGAEKIGCVGLHDEEGVGNLGYWIARAHWGMGYATEAARAVIGLARTLGHQQLVGRHFLDNPASGRVLTKLGFRPVAESAGEFSLGRNAFAPALRYRLDLVEAVGHGGDEGGNMGRPRKAA